MKQHTQIVVGSIVVCEWRGSPPAVGERIAVILERKHTGLTDPELQSVLGTVAHRRWKVHGKVATCECVLEVVESTASILRAAGGGLDHG